MNIHSILDFTRFLNSFRAIKRVIFTIGDGGPENDSEHSYQLAMMAWYIISAENLKLDRNLVIKYALVHDLVEVYAGDTYFYRSDKEEKHKKMSRVSHNEVGRIGEETACMFLVKRGFKIIEQNYWKKWGEIDIIAKNKGKLHFVEVKTVSRENLRDVSRETMNEYRPEENIHPKKLERLSRIIQTYLLEKNYENEWQFDVIAVFLDIKNREARCRYIEDVII